MRYVCCMIFSSSRRHTSCALVTGVQTCALPIFVDRAGGKIPTVEMAGDDDRARGWVAAWDLRDDVARRLLADHPGGEQQFHPQRAGRALALANELVGVGVGDRPGGDRGHAVREIGHARVRIAVIVGADRADDDADRALLRGDVRSHEPTSRSEEHTSELQSLMRISYAVFCLKKKQQT